MVIRLEDTRKAEPLFAGWEETLIWSCLQKVMGSVYVTDAQAPRSAAACVCCFRFYAGEPDRELLYQKPKGFAILVPQNEAWAELIEACFPQAKRVTRYAIRKDTVFDRAALTQLVDALPQEYTLRQIDAELYDRCLEERFTEDFVSCFGSKERFLELGAGFVILKAGRIVAGASSYTRYLGGIEIEVDTAETERRKHLAAAACAALILHCLDAGLYPSWDAQNRNSVRLAQKLGYEFSREYPAYELWDL